MAVLDYFGLSYFKGKYDDQVKGILNDIVADEYSSSATYAVGDYVLHDGKLYICKTAIATAEEWTAAHWTKVDISGEVKDLKSSIADVNDYALNAYATDTTSGAIATFPDGAEDIPIKQLSVAIEPVQDLHGYDNPWPAGGGKNKFPITLTTQTKNGTTFTVANDGSVTVSGTPSGLTRVSLNELSITPEAEMKFSMIGNATGVRVFCKRVENGGTTYPTMTPSSAAVVGVEYSSFLLEIDTTFSGTAVTLKFQLEVGSTVTDWSPYSNICPISGHTECNVTRTGKNLCDESKLLQATGWTVSNGVYSGINVNLHFAFHTGFPTPLVYKENTQYTVSMHFKSTNESKLTVIGFKYSDNTESTTYIQGTTEHVVSATSTAGKTVSYFLLSYGNSDTVYISDMQIEEGSTVTAYEEYRGTTYPIIFPTGTGTVYGGNITVNKDGSGSLVVDWKSKSLNGSEIWTAYPNHETEWAYCGAFSSNEVYPDPLNSIYRKSNFLASVDNIATITNAKAAFSFSPVSNRSNMYVRYPSFITSTQAWKEYLANNNLQVVYKLAVPLATIPLTAEQVGVITSLYGVNNFWADTGDVDVTIRADTALYIAKKIAEALNA